MMTKQLWIIIIVTTFFAIKNSIIRQSKYILFFWSVVGPKVRIYYHPLTYLCIWNLRQETISFCFFLSWSFEYNDVEIYPPFIDLHKFRRLSWWQRNGSPQRCFRWYQWHRSTSWHWRPSRWSRANWWSFLYRVPSRLITKYEKNPISILLH